MEWDDEKEKWFFSIVDVCGVLTDSKDYLTARKYWNKLKQRLKEEGNETVTNCHQLKMKAADRIYLLPIEFRNCQKKRKTNFCKWHLQKMPLIFNYAVFICTNNTGIEGVEAYFVCCCCEGSWEC